MSKKNIILKVENLSKQYRLGTVGTGTLSHDLNRWWHSIRGKEDPYLKIGDTNDRSTKGTSDYVWALQDVNFEVEAGEVLGIIGKNGAGKSTLLKILSKVTAPTTGSIKSRGRMASLLEVGTGFNPELTGRENIFLNGAILGMTKKEITAKLDEIIEFSGCERYIDTPTKRYSSGMTVRLAFAVAAFLEPEILVVDEVLAVGDAEFQKKAIGKMQDISREGGRTVLFVSHNMAAVKSLCTRGIVLENGTLIFAGNTDDCVNKYLESSKLNNTWTNDSKQSKGISIRSVFSEVTGKQPNLKLNISVEVSIIEPINKKGFLAFYIGGNDGTHLMEAIPEYDFVDCSKDNSNKIINAEIEINGFIPKIYNLGVWFGIDHNITLDWKKEVITFEIESSPLQSRTINFPNHAGFIIPKSRIINVN